MRSVGLSLSVKIFKVLGPFIAYVNRHYLNMMAGGPMLSFLLHHSVTPRIDGSILRVLSGTNLITGMNKSALSEIDDVRLAYC